jgi:hypothetical protein
MADMLMTYIMNVLNKHKLSHKMIPFCGDNSNKFWGCCKERNKQCFSKLKISNLKMNIQGIGCATHILHNALQTSADILPTVVEAIVNNIFQYFHIYTASVEELKEFCDFIDVEYKQILGNVITRWLSLQPAITRVISIFNALKSCFLS